MTAERCKLDPLRVTCVCGNRHLVSCDGDGIGYADCGCGREIFSAVRIEAKGEEWPKDHGRDGEPWRDETMADADAFAALVRKHGHITISEAVALGLSHNLPARLVQVAPVARKAWLERWFGRWHTSRFILHGFGDALTIDSSRSLPDRAPELREFVMHWWLDFRGEPKSANVLSRAAFRYGYREISPEGPRKHRRSTLEEILVSWSGSILRGFRINQTQRNKTRLFYLSEV